MDSHPHSRELEEAILYLSIIDYQAYLQNAILEPEDFYIHKNAFVWDSILKLKRAGNNVDIISISEELDRNKKLEEIGGHAYLGYLMTVGADGLSVDYYIDALHDYKARRDALEQCNKVAAKSFDMSTPFDISGEIGQLQNLRWRDDQDGIREMSQVSDSLGAIIDKGFTAVKTDIPDLDKILEGGLFEGLYVSAGSPSSGKTALWWAASQNIARSKLFAQPRVLFFSLEMTAEELLARTACGMVGVSWNAVRAGQTTQQQNDSVKKTAEALGIEFTNRLVIVDKRSTVYDICRLIDLYMPDVVIVDHLNEIKRHDRSENIVYFGMVASTLKDKAKQRHIPIVLLHQLNRDSSKEDRPPIMTDLKWCAELEEKADVIALLHRPNKQTIKHVRPMEAQLDIYIRKFRNGQPNTMTTLLFNLQAQTFGKVRTLP